MALVLGQSDTAASFGNVAMCSALTVGTTPINSQLNPAAASGASSHSFTCAASATNSALVFMQCAANTPGIVSWASGNWVVNLNFSTVNSNLTWTETFICRANSGGTNQATVGSLTGQAVTLSATSTMTVSGSSQAAASTDVVYIVCAFSNAAASSQSASVTFNKTITTPLISVAEIVDISDYGASSAFDNFYKLYSFSKFRFRNNYRVETFTNNISPEQTIPMDDQTEYPDFVLRPTYKAYEQPFLTKGTSPENTIAEDWQPRYIDSVYRPTLKVGDQQFYASTIQPENTLQLDWHPLYTDSVLRPTFNASKQPFFTTSPKPEGQLPLDWDAFFPDRIVRPSIPVTEQMHVAAVAPPVTLNWSVVFPDRITRSFQPVTEHQVFATAVVVPPPPAPTYFSVSYPDYIFRPRNTSLLLDASETSIFSMLPPPPIFLGAFDVNSDSVTSGTSTSSVTGCSSKVNSSTSGSSNNSVSGPNVNVNSVSSGTFGGSSSGGTIR